MYCPTLTRVQKRFVDFDVTNPEHLEAFRMLSLGSIDEKGNIHTSQHPTLRFHLEGPFVDIPSMMNYRIGQAYLKLVLQK